MNRVKKHLPGPILKLAAMAKRMVVYRDYDAEKYWRQRASQNGQARVLWANETYNRCFRRVQQALLANLIPDRGEQSLQVLDIGCGIGHVAAFLAGLHPQIQVDAVDFEEMILAARKENPHSRINYIADSAEGFTKPGRPYQIIVSSACYSAIRDKDRLRQALSNGADMLCQGGLIIMIDPFHRWRFLARARMSSAEVTRFMAQRGLQRHLKSGVLFWPFREWLANSEHPPAFIEQAFQRGEKWLARLGTHLWADYKVLVFKHPGPVQAEGN